jgi:Icc protein
VLLAHVSDLHIDGGPRATARAEQVLAFLDRLPRQVDAVLLTGDIADHGTEEEYAQVRRLLRDRQRFLICPGNHDRRGPYRTVLLGHQAGDEPINQVHELPGLRVLMLDSSIPGRDDGCLTDDTLRWLAEMLQQATTTPTLVAFHHPPVELHSPFIDAIRQHGADRLAALLAGHPQVVAVLCGHAHTPAVSSFAGRPLLVAPGVASTLRLPWETSIDLDFAMPPALAFHVLDDRHRITTHYRLVPDRAGD